MPAFKKRSLSLYLRNQCERQLALYLYNDQERLQHGMPTRQQNRAGLAYIGQAGYEWQDEKISELRDLFGATNVHEGVRNAGGKPGAVSLIDVLPLVSPYQFIVEGTYESDTATFRNGIGMTNLTDFYGGNVGIGETRPDVIQVLPPINQIGVLTSNNPYEQQVRPDGTTISLSNNDSRLRLRVIDIKLTSEPGVQYFAEVVYYSITLAAWLVENGLDNRFVVIAAPAVWPGQHDASELAKHKEEWYRQAHIPSGLELFQALEKDVELAIFDIYSSRLRKLLAEEFPRILAQEWKELAWHVDFRCKGCEFLGYPWSDQDTQEPGYRLRCLPMAEDERNLSRVYGLSRGASEQLRLTNISDVNALANEESTSTVFDNHQGLRLKRTAFPSRAQALRSGQNSIVPNSGGDALMPRWPSLHIYIFLDYDLSSSITVTMAIRASWVEPLPFDSQLRAEYKQWTHRQDEDEVFLVDTRDLEREKREFLRFLRQLAKIVNETRILDDTHITSGRRTTRSTYQVYLWDEAQRKQLIRMVGRHLPDILADTSLHELLWLFPPPEVLQQPEESTRKSTITLVKPVVDNTIALNVPHYYRLLDLAQRVKPDNLSAPNPHPLYVEPMSDLIPMERLHEYWNRASNWLEKQNHILNTTRSKVYSLSLSVKWLEDQLRDVLSRQAAPPIVRPQRRVFGLAPVNHLLLGFAQLDSALSGLDMVATRSMPPHEREARLKSARLERRLEGQERQTALEALNNSNGTNLADTNTLLIYQLSLSSCEVNIKRGEFMIALAPEAVHGFLDQNAFGLTSGTPFESTWHYNQTIEQAMLTAATVEAIDRTNALIGLRVNNAGLLTILERANTYDFSRNVILDPIHKDYLTAKIELTLRGIGNPPSANSIQVTQALPLGSGRPRRSPETPASEVLWNALNVQQQLVNRNLPFLRQNLERYFGGREGTLDTSQWAAWEESLSHRMALLWGPPGTGKSRTLRAIILGALLDAHLNQLPLRMLITANTYNAIDNIILKLDIDLRELIEDNCQLYRIQSKFREAPSPAWVEQYPSIHNLILNRAQPSADILNLRRELQSPTGIVIVACTPEQLHNLAIAPNSNSLSRPEDTVKAWFDMIVLDEASQMDVATSTLVLSKIKGTGICIMAGDDLQLPPIHQAKAPEGVEGIVGSVYNFYRRFHDMVPKSLNINYRSNSSITQFTRLAGYSESLQSHSTDLQLSLSDDISSADAPVGWPTGLLWTPAWQELVSPSFPTVSFIYADTLSSQVNEFEADSIASLLWLLRGSLRKQLRNERMVNGLFRPETEELHDSTSFWQNAVGVVTPHKAQMAKVVSRLRQVFPHDSGELIYGAVDTVERYQGHERDVIIASFGIGDPDIIKSEDEFLYSLNRFNVMVSRARAKVIVFMTQSLLNHLSDDIEVLNESRLLKQYAESYCDNSQQLGLGYIKNGQSIVKSGLMRRHQS
jgi:hypothetical protein